jgi:hypothetical protein
MIILIVEVKKSLMEMMTIMMMTQVHMNSISFACRRRLTAIVNVAATAALYTTLSEFESCRPACSIGASSSSIYFIQLT